MNNSISTISAGSPIRWPDRSFAAGPTALVILAAVGLALVVGLVGGGIIATHRAQLLSPQMFVISALVLQLGLEGAPVVLLIAMLPRLSKLSFRELGFYMPRPWQIGVAILGAIAMVVVANGGASLIQTLLHQKHEQAVVQIFKQAAHQPHIVWFFAVFAIVLAPFMEETIFRLFIFNAGRRYGGFWVGSIISGLCFGAAHMDAIVLGPLALAGIILCYVYQRTGNAFCSMITHGLFNAVTVIAIIYFPKLAQ